MRILVSLKMTPDCDRVLERGLRENGYVVDAVPDGEAAVRHLLAYDYTVAILDWRMPEKSGLDALVEVRRRDIRTPILMLTARDTTGDRIVGLNTGADDYLVKPFDFSELLARLGALQRRPALTVGPELSCGDLRLDPNTRKLTVNGEPVTVTATELGLIELLLRRSPAVLTRQTIATQVWDDEANAVGSNTMDVHIGRLRAKLFTEHGPDRNGAGPRVPPGGPMKATRAHRTHAARVRGGGDPVGRRLLHRRRAGTERRGGAPAHLRSQLENCLARLAESNKLIIREDGSAAPSPQTDGGDIDDVPSFVWRVSASGVATALTSDAPVLTRGQWKTGGMTASLGGTQFRFEVIRAGNGWLVAGQSVAEIGHVTEALIVPELLFGAVLVVAVFAGSLLVGLRASAPLEVRTAQAGRVHRRRIS